MTREEYSLLFHKLQLNLVAFKMLFQVDKEVLTLVNAAIEAEREACALVVERNDNPETRLAAAAIRARGETK